MSKAAEKRLGPLDSDIAGAAARIQQLRDREELSDVRTLILHLKPDDRRIGRIEVCRVSRTYAPTPSVDTRSGSLYP